MLSKSTIRLIRSLKSAAGRHRAGMFIVEGNKMVLDLVNTDLTIVKIFALQAFIDQHKDITNRFVDRVEVLTRQKLKQISFFSTPADVIALIKIPKITQTIQPQKPIVALDNIQDPGNIGTIIRTSAWFGINNIIAGNKSADIYNPKVIQATMGAFLKVNYKRLDLHSEIEKLKLQNKIIATGLSGKSIFDYSFDNKDFVIIVGNESKGISKELFTMADEVITIPGNSTGNIPESLNASVALSIICAAYSKQINKNQ